MKLTVIIKTIYNDLKGDLPSNNELSRLMRLVKDAQGADAAPKNAEPSVPTPMERGPSAPTPNERPSDPEAHARIFFLKCLTKYPELSGWSFQTDSAKCRLGVCKRSKKIISLSRHFLQSDNGTKAEIEDTILHEIAHAMTPGHHHDDVWRQKALSIGCSGKTCGPSFSKPKFYLRCQKGCCMIPRQRKSNVQGKVCTKCKSNVFFVDASA